MMRVASPPHCVGKVSGIGTAGDRGMFGAAPRVIRSVAPAVKMGAALAIGTLCLLATPLPAAAQLGWFSNGDSSSQDAYDTIASHGFRLVGPLMQNRDVYIADVIDRRQRRERLIISRDDGRILQRYLVDLSGDGGPARLSPPRRARPDSDFFSRLVRGFGDDAPMRPPADIDQPDRRDAVEPSPPRAPRPTKVRPSDIEPRVATRRDDAPITARPLTPEPSPAPTRAAPSAPTATATPATPVPAEKPQVVPAPAPTPSPPPTRATVVTTDPLRIPGVKEKEPTKPAGVVAAKPAVPAKPAASGDVPVAPLD